MQSNFWSAFLRLILAIVVGNAVYYFVLAPMLPLAARHQRGRVDLGLFIDFLLCVAVWGVARMRARRA